MADASQISEHIEVVGFDGGHVGTVEDLEGRRLKPAKNDLAAGGEHHYLHLDLVEAVQEGKIVLNRAKAEAKDEWGRETRRLSDQQ
ncbi:DUF2171 domain-containing protein [Roseomonas marmotae]|uniref:DUF2171 domain-containing protein n=2 Tax=Roseomonas marmotae TaxID=2768161 RepID=A0ABS3KCN9_9PROT|nr:DUF2171 domain-containing protein [Roseomonas marmotae]MBO1074121.1 DUF2171 domain-containing protein [Roseomonas marmotae]QTI78903.1 DUF2171 domain-containing protein [Roseomonas marmotae]